MGLNSNFLVCSARSGHFYSYAFARKALGNSLSVKLTVKCSVVPRALVSSHTVQLTNRKRLVCACEMRKLHVCFKWKVRVSLTHLKLREFLLFAARVLILEYSGRESYRVLDIPKVHINLLQCIENFTLSFGFQITP